MVRSGLGAAVDALASLQPDAAPTTLLWIRAARRAVVAIEPETSLSFQRAAIQDAFRATVDACAAVATRGD